jgi:hypothetical protein
MLWVRSDGCFGAAFAVKQSFESPLSAEPLRVLCYGNV